jgi:arginine repressor
LAFRFSQYKKQNEDKQNKELEKNKRPRNNGQYGYTVNNGYMKQNEEKQNKELEKNKRPRKNGQYRYTVNNGYMKQNEEKQNVLFHVPIVNCVSVLSIISWPFVFL